VPGGCRNVVTRDPLKRRAIVFTVANRTTATFKLLSRGDCVLEKLKKTEGSTQKRSTLEVGYTKGEGQCQKG